MKLLILLTITAVALAGFIPRKKFRPAVLGFSTTASTTTAKFDTNVTQVTTTQKTEQITESVRRCTLAELDGCKLEAANDSFIDDCTSSCRFHLGMLPKDNDSIMTCFGEATRESELLFECLNRDVDGLFTEEDENVTMIRRPDYTQLAHTLRLAQNAPKFASPLVKKARSAFTQFREYQKCVTTCLRDQTVSCFERQDCGLNLPESQHIATIFQSCRTYKAYVYESARNTCRCLAFQYKIKDLVGACAFMGPVQMRMI